MGYKAGTDDIKKYKIQGQIPFLQREDKNLRINVDPILKFLSHKRKVTNYTGRGNRVRVISKSSGKYISAYKPRRMPHTIAFDATIKAHYLNTLPNLSDLNSIDDVVPKSSSIPSQDQLQQLAIRLKMSDVREKIHELHAPLTLYFIVDASASMCKTLDQIIKVIKSVHQEGYKKKDKVSVISFQGRDARILQRPSVSVSVALDKLRKLEPSSYTPIASALRKTMTMIRQEEIKGCSIPVILILSDLGANVSQKYADLSAQTGSDFQVIEQELDELSKEIFKKGIKTVIMKPQKSFATRYLGVNPVSVQHIQDSFLNHADARIFEFDAYDPKTTILQLKRILK